MFCAIQLSKSDPTPLYIQLANELSALIDQGILPSETKLPTIRTLSQKLGINRDTVVSAYKLLETEGRVIAHIGSGTYVAPIPPIRKPSPPIPPVSCSSIHFNKALFPVSLCKDLLSNILDREGWSSFVDPLYRERHALKQSVSKYLLSIGVQASSAHIRITDDIYSILVDILKCSHKIAICTENYRDLTYTSFLKALGFKSYDITMTKDGIDLIELEKTLKTGNVSYIFVNSYLQNPTGVSYSLEVKKQLITLANTYNCYIIEDATFSDFTTDDELLPLYQLCPERVIYIHHFSKIYLPQLSYSFVVLPSPLSKRLPDTLHCTLNEKFLHAYLCSDTFCAIRQTILDETYAKYEKLTQCFLQYPTYFEVYTFKSTLFFWIKPLLLPMEQLCQHFISHNILVAPGTLFTTSEQCDYLRLSISHLTLEELDCIIDAIKSFETMPP